MKERLVIGTGIGTERISRFQDYNANMVLLWFHLASHNPFMIFLFIQVVHNLWHLQVTNQLQDLAVACVAVKLGHGTSLYFSSFGLNHTEH